MYPTAVRARALELRTEGRTIAAVARELGVSRATVRDWLRGTRRPPETSCWACAGESCPEAPAYCYLLGQYLGDGYLVTSIRVPRLRITCANAYPGIAEEVDRAIADVSARRVSAVAAIGCTDRGAYWMHWPCLFPQHGLGPKHTRAIELTPWQEALVAQHPWRFIRGLIHSDGCRTVNRVVVRGKPYEYVRYFFSNTSRDILAIMGRALDQVGVQWRYNRPNSISVARRPSVALLDRHVGPKH